MESASRWSRLQDGVGFKVAPTRADMPETMRAILVLAAMALLCATAATAGPPIYKWVDADGHTHFTQDLGQVPPQHRKAAQLSVHRVRTRDVQTFEQAPAKSVRATTRGSARGAQLEIPFEMRGSAMWVYVKVNDRVTAPFIVDTGASDVAIPAHVATRAGITVTADTPHATYQTANGMVRKPIVHVDSIQVGDARVEGVRSSVSDNMPVGLLGGTFFNNFTFQIDAATQMITLRPNPLVRGGIPEQQWRQRFRDVHRRITRVRSYLDNNMLTDESRVQELERKHAAFEVELEALEQEADLAGVPQAWRTD